MSEITKLEPKLVWELFDAITRVPRPSKKEEKIREFLVDFAKKHNIDYQTDETSNVVMRVPGTKGYENRPCVILQSHMDMVCEKNSDTAFDFDKDPIRTKIVDGWVKAEGTTLGADDGIGMAAALAALLDPALEHGPLEALFTVDEETGLTGAFGLGKGMLTGRYLVNLDSEDEGEIFIGCAGGGSNLGGLISPFMGEKIRGEADYRFIAVEPASCPSFSLKYRISCIGSAKAYTPSMKMLYLLGSRFCCVMAVISMALPPFVVKYYTTFFPPAPFIKITPSPQVGKGGNSLFVFIKNHP